MLLGDAAPGPPGPMRRPRPRRPGPESCRTASEAMQDRRRGTGDAPHPAVRSGTAIIDRSTPAAGPPAASRQSRDPGRRLRDCRPHHWLRDSRTAGPSGPAPGWPHAGEQRAPAGDRHPGTRTASRPTSVFRDDDHGSTRHLAGVIALGRLVPELRRSGAGWSGSRSGDRSASTAPRSAPVTLADHREP